MLKQTFQSALLAMLAALLSGCSTFNRDWDRMAASPVPQTGIEGRWAGTWKSEDSGHTDQLRCIVSRKEGSNYLARFHAKYDKVFTFGYTVPLKVEQQNDKFLFEGEANLHWWAGGVYHYKGTATDTNFYSTYKCKADHGTFEMTRP